MAASPLSPPLMTFDSVSMRYLLFGFSPLWHFTHDFSRIGLMSFSKVRPVLLAAGGSLLASHSAFFLSFSAAISATVDRQSATATRALMFFPKPAGERLEFTVRLFMAHISTKDGHGVKKIRFVRKQNLPMRGRERGRPCAWSRCAVAKPWKLHEPSYGARTVPVRNSSENRRV